MPRDYGSVYGRIWADQDWRALEPLAQHAYLMVLTHPKLSPCGVLDVSTAKLVPLAAGLTVRGLDAQFDRLAVDKYLVIDDMTDERLVRSFVRWDGLIRLGRPAKAIAKDWRMIASPLIRTAVVDELRRLWDEGPKLTGWAQLAEEEPTLMALIEKPPPPGLRSVPAQGAKHAPT